jgi:hypothetical protein
MGTRRGRRLAIRLAACAVIGAVGTVGVAWGFLYAPVPTRALPFLNDAAWLGPTPAHWPPRAEIVTGYASRGRVLRVAGCAKDASGNTASFGQVSFTAGFPFLALDGLVVAENGVELRMVGLWVGKPTSKRLLPTRPLLPGFALDTSLYAACAFLVWSAPSAGRRIRRRLRRARGHCPACGYDLRGSTSAVCPECGVAPKGGREGVAEGRGGEEVPSASAPAE